MSKSKRKPMSQINVVPFIDVVLMLLIIFMITAPLIQQGVEVTLPQAAANPLPPDMDEPVVVTVDKKGRFFLDIGDEPTKPIDAKKLVNRVAAVRSLKPRVPVLVRGDRAVDYGRVVDVMVLLQQAGIEKVGLMTDQPQK